MMFPDHALFDYVLINLGEAVAAAAAPPINPLPCDRYIARSCLQKAIRRAEPGLAQRALANLFLHDRRMAWRALTIIAMEDVGVANVDLLSQIVAAYRNRAWRGKVGGDWLVLATLAQRMAESSHCQAACDLLLRATTDVAEEPVRAAALEAAADTLAEQLWASDAPAIKKAIIVMALGGELSRGQQHRDPSAVFDLLTETGQSLHVVATCRAAWKISRNPMAFLLPIVWEQWLLTQQNHNITDDPMPPVQMLNGVPGYSLDQFTRIGNSVSRAMLKASPDLSQLLDALRVGPITSSQAIGDAMFLIEGGLIKHRAVWPFANSLRTPNRMLPTTVALGGAIRKVMAHLASNHRQIAVLRQQHFQPIRPQGSSRIV